MNTYLELKKVAFGKLLRRLKKLDKGDFVDVSPGDLQEIIISNESRVIIDAIEEALFPSKQKAMMDAKKRFKTVDYSLELVEFLTEDDRYKEVDSKLQSLLPPNNTREDIRKALMALEELEPLHLEQKVAEFNESAREDLDEI